MSRDVRIDGMFDFSPDEEVEPIWITDRLVTLFGDIEAPEGVVSLRLLKDLTFGTGGHPSTRLVIWKLLTLIDGEEGVPSPFLEIGATTGLLAIVAATSGTLEVFHGSDEEEATALAEDNGALNGLELMAEPAFLSLHPNKRTEYYSAIATQTGGRPSELDKVPLVYNALKPGGWLVWAGHTAKNHQTIKARLSEFFNPVEVDDFHGWPVIVLNKNKT